MFLWGIWGGDPPSHCGQSAIQAWWAYCHRRLWWKRLLLFHAVVIILSSVFCYCRFNFVDARTCLVCCRFHCPCFCVVRAEPASQLRPWSFPPIYWWRHFRIQGWFTWNCQKKWDSGMQFPPSPCLSLFNLNFLFSFNLTKLISTCSYCCKIQFLTC